MRFRFTARPAEPLPDDSGDETAASKSKRSEGVPLSRVVPRQLVGGPEIIMRGTTRSMAAEKIRRLKTLLEHDEKGSPQVIVVTSATPQEGKSVVALNLALAFASDRKTPTLLVDADLRRPSVERWVVPPPSLGLAELLTERAELEHAILHFKDTALEILPAGQPPKYPVDLLGSEHCRTLVATLRERYVRVIIDTPPIVPFTDADVVGRNADGTLLVVRARQTPKALFVQAVLAVTSSRVLGTVLNDVVVNLADRDRQYGRYYGSYYGRHDGGDKS
jgi:capsular exopolysaccharide synthesis family protein